MEISKNPGFEIDSAFDAGYYEKYYRNYAAQNPPRKINYYSQWAERLCHPGLPRQIHDLGCSFGFFLNSLPEPWEIFGSDVSHYAIGEAQKLCLRGVFRAENGMRNPLFPETFGVVTAFDTLEHVPDLARAAEVIRGQLVDGGFFLFVVPVYDGLSGPLVWILDKDPTHLHRWGREEWLRWAQNHFKVIAWEGLLRYLTPLGYLHLSSRKFRNHLPAIFVACQKEG
jgi:SAM-dependent methyltransferase